MGMIFAISNWRRNNTMMESGKYLALRTNKHTHTWIDSVMQQEVMTLE